MSEEEKSFISSVKIEIEGYLHEVLSEEKKLQAMQFVNGGGNNAIKLNAILKRNFFNDGISLELETGLDLFSQKSNPLIFLKNFSPLQKRIITSTESLETLKIKLQKKYPNFDISDINSKEDFFEKVNTSGLILTEMWSPVEELEKIIESFPEKNEFFIDSCPANVLIPSLFSPEELDTLSKDCCEPTEEKKIEKFSIPEVEVEIPEVFTEAEIFSLIDKVTEISKGISDCSNNMASAGRSIEEYREFMMRFDILDSYLQERNTQFQTLYASVGNLLEEKFAILRKSQEIISQISAVYKSTFSPFMGIESPYDVKNTVVIPEGTSVQEANEILFREYTDINSTSLAGKEDSSVTTYLNDIASLIANYGANTYDLSKIVSNIETSEEKLGLINFSDTDISSLFSNFSVESSKLREILNSSLSNQIGYKDQYFLTIGSTALYEEVKTFFELYSSDFSDIVRLKNKDSEDEILSSELLGLFHENLWNKYDSPERIDFLFTPEEQGFSNKPSIDDLTSDSQGSLEKLAVDETMMAEFMLSYREKQESRLFAKIAEIQLLSQNILNDIKEKAKEEATYAFSLGKFSLDFFSYSNYESSDFKEFSKNFAEEAEIMSNVRKTLEDRILFFQNIVAQSEACTETYENQLREMYTYEQTFENLPSPCSDPFGISTVNPYLPGITKNCYWKEYTKCMQTVSLMPIPELLHLNKRLFRYYPVGLKFPVFFPPGTFPTLALGIPDKNISIPMPMLWNHIFTLTTSAGIFVLWLNYTPPFFLFPYLMHIDEKGNTAFLVTPNGKTDIPHESIDWKEGAMYTRSLIQNIPGIEIPLKKLPSLDSLIDTNSTETSNDAISKIQEKIKNLADKIQGDTLGSLSEEDIARRAKLNSIREKLKKTINNIPPPLESIREMLQLLQEESLKVTDQLFNFEPLTFPSSPRKQKESKSDSENLLDSLKTIEEAGGNVDIKFVNVTDILTREVYNFLDTKEGQNFISDFQQEIDILESNLSVSSEIIAENAFLGSEKALARVSTIIQMTGKLLELIIPKIDAEKIGFLALPLSLIPLTLPEPCNYNVKLSSLPPWVSITLGALVLLPSLANELSAFDSLKIMNEKVNFSYPLPSAKEAITVTCSLLFASLLNKANINFPGWPNEIPVIENLDQLSQFSQIVKQEIFKKKLRLPSLFEGISPIVITPEILNETLGKAIAISIETSISLMISRFLEANAGDQQSITLKFAEAMLLFKAIVGTEIYDLNEDDIKSFSISILRSASSELENLKPLFSAIDISPDKEEKSFLKKLFPNSKGSDGDDTIKIQIAPDLSLAIFLGFASKVASGTNKTIPWITALGLCAIGPAGWFSLSTFNPTAAMEKFPPYERLCMKNIPFVIFLDQLIATSQRVGGFSNNYLPPYRD